MAVPLLDLKRQYDIIKDKIDQAVSKVFEHELFILGPEVKAFEKRVAEFCQSKIAVGVASGTDALLIALKAAGVGAGDEVITADFSFFASTSVISRVGATPVFVDIEPDSYNMDPQLVEKAITKKTKAIIPVHLFGQCADMDPLMVLAQEYNLTIIEDAAQAISARYKNKMAGSIGHYGCFSFFPSKNLGGVGDGGMIISSESDSEETLKMLRMHGWKKKYRPEVVGYNSRLDTLQAAVLLVKIEYLNQWSEKRRENARLYDAAFAGTRITTPVVKDYAYHIYNQYTIAVENRPELLDVLTEKNIGHDVYYPLPFHRLDCYKDLPYKEGDFPVSERTAESVVSIPVFPDLTAEELEEVVEVVKAVSA